MKGRKPKPTALHKLHHTVRTRHKSRRDEPKVEGDLDRPPKGLTPAQRAGWHYVLRHAPKGLLKKLDRGLLVVWCEAEARHRTAAKALADEGLVVVGSMGQPIASPYVRIVDAAARTMLRAAEQMGLSPASRPRIQVSAPPEKPDPNDPWAQLRLVPGGKPDPTPAA